MSYETKCIYRILVNRALQKGNPYRLEIGGRNLCLRPEAEFLDSRGELDEAGNN